MSYRNPLFQVWISQAIKGVTAKRHYVGMVALRELGFLTEQYELLGWRVHTE